MEFDLLDLINFINIKSDNIALGTNGVLLYHNNHEKGAGISVQIKAIAKSLESIRVDEGSVAEKGADW